MRSANSKTRLRRCDQRWLWSDSAEELVDLRLTAYLKWTCHRSVHLGRVHIFCCAKKNRWFRERRFCSECAIIVQTTNIIALISILFHYISGICIILSVNGFRRLSKQLNILISRLMVDIRGNWMSDEFLWTIN